MKRTVVFGLIGSKLDGPRGEQRWERWRPTVAICQHPDFLVDRLELIYQTGDEALLEVIQGDIARLSPETTLRRHLVTWRDPWDFEEVYGALHDLAVEYPFDVDTEDYLLHLTTGTHVAQICLFLLAESRKFPARLLQASPPARHLNGQLPGQINLIDLDLSRYDKIAQRFRREQRDGLSFLKQGIDTRDPAFNRLIEQIEKVAVRSRDPVLLMGPTGAGKSRLARRIFELKKQRRQISGPYVEVNCATLRGDGAMSALFGHRRGAFTGALADRPGLLRQADGGLLFLDEIGELGLDEQAMLLRALEEKRFLPLGADVEVASEFQLIAGTNRDLRAEVAAGKFREDLMARLDFWTFALPGLAERRLDLEPNLQYELATISTRLGVQVSFNREANRRFLDFALAPRAVWRGNFRDLNAAVIRMATLAEGGRIDLAGVEEEIGRLEKAWGEVGGSPRQANDDHHFLLGILGAERLEQLDLFDQVQLAAVLRVCQKSRSLTEAGRTLFAASRQNKKQVNDADRLRKYLVRFGLSWQDVQFEPQ